MCEKRWTYFDPHLGQQFIGLYHSHVSGHVMMYHNQNVFLIDFGILADKEYSFFINDQMYRMQIKKKNEAFDYSLVEHSPHKASNTTSRGESMRKWIERFKQFFNATA